MRIVIGSRVQGKVENLFSCVYSTRGVKLNASLSTVACRAARSTTRTAILNPQLSSKDSLLLNTSYITNTYDVILRVKSSH